MAERLLRPPFFHGGLGGLRQAFTNQMARYMSKRKNRSLIRACKKGTRIRKPRSTESKHGYTNRNVNLQAMGFRSYGEYLKSDMWAIIRRLAFESNGTACVRCGRPASQIHHSSYDLKTLAGSDLQYLHPVCGTCHESAELLAGEKVHKNDANRHLGVAGDRSGREGHLARQQKRLQHAEKLLAKLPGELIDEIRGKFGRGNNGMSMRDLATHYKIKRSVVRLILGWKVR